MVERDIFEVANQLHGYIDEGTPEGLARFLRREGDEACNLAKQIAALKAENERLMKALSEQIDRDISGIFPSERALAERAGGVKREHDAYRVHSAPDDYYGTGGDKLQFHPLTPSQIEHGETATPLYSLTTEPAAPEGRQEAVALTYGQKLIAEAIEHHFGERGHNFDEYDGDTTVVDVWDAFDALTRPAEQAVTDRKFALGDRVTKIKGSSWTGRVVGFYETSLTPIGYCVESENEPGSVQIYPEAALSEAEGGK